MRFEAYLITEDRRTEEISEKEVKKLLQTTHKEAWDRRKLAPIYRGISFKKPFGFVRPSQSERTSANTINVYTLLMDNLSSWSKFPKRSKSLICSTSRGRAADYGYSGGIYTVVPKNGAKIGVCPKYDIWDSFNIMSIEGKPVTANAFNFMVRDMMSLVNREEARYSSFDKSWFERATWGKFKAELDKLDKDRRKVLEYIENEDPEYGGGLVKFFGLDKTNKKFIDIIEGMIDPVKNEFELKTTGDPLPVNKEVWTDADCVLIKDKDWDPSTEYYRSDEGEYTDEEEEDPYAI